MVAAITLAAVAADLANSFIVEPREDKADFIKLNDTSWGTWKSEATYNAHQDSGANDSTYKMIYDVAQAISEEIADVTDWNDMSEIELHERLDSLVPIYNYDLKKWLLENPGAEAACEEAVLNCYISTDSKDFNLIGLLQAGYYQQLDAIAGILCQAIQAEYESRLEDAEDSDLD